MTRLATACAKPHPVLACPVSAPNHAIAAVAKWANEMPRDSVIPANLCGRGDTDFLTLAERLGVEM